MSGDPSKKVQRGDRMEIPAETFNTFIDAARLVRGRQHDQLQKSQPEFSQSGIILVRNNSGEPRQRFDVLGIRRPIIRPDVNLSEFKNQVAVEGVTPRCHAGRFVVLLEPLPDKAIGRAVVSGVTVARVQVDDEDSQFAEAEDDEPGRLLATSAGSGFILWKEKGTGERWAVVRISNPTDAFSCSTSTTELPSSTTIEPTTQEPTTTTVEPSTSTVEPTTSTAESPTSTVSPSTTTGEPTTSTESPPSTTTNDATTSTAEPTSTSDLPTSTTADSTTSTASPTSTTGEPTSTSSVSTSTPEPTTSTGESTTTFEPTSTSGESTSTSSPPTSTSEVTSTTGEPTSTSFGSTSTSGPGSTSTNAAPTSTSQPTTSTGAPTSTSFPAGCRVYLADPPISLSDDGRSLQIAFGSLVLVNGQISCVQEGVDVLPIDACCPDTQSTTTSVEVSTTLESDS